MKTIYKFLGRILGRRVVCMEHGYTIIYRLERITPWGTLYIKAYGYNYYLINTNLIGAGSERDICKTRWCFI